jgi:hypothetical protein
MNDIEPLSGITPSMVTVPVTFVIFDSGPQPTVKTKEQQTTAPNIRNINQVLR